MKNSFNSGEPLELMLGMKGHSLHESNELYHLQFSRNYGNLKARFQKKIKQDLNIEFLTLVAHEIRSAYINCSSEKEMQDQTIDLDLHQSTESFEKLDNFQNKVIYYFLSLLAIYESEKKKAHFRFVK